jgi:hypothetical protein
MSTRNAGIRASAPGGRKEVFPVPVKTQLFGSVIGSTVRVANTFFDAHVCSAEFSNGIGIGIDGPCARAGTAFSARMHTPNACPRKLIEWIKL